MRVYLYGKTVTSRSANPVHSPICEPITRPRDGRMSRTRSPKRHTLRTHRMGR